DSLADTSARSLNATAYTAGESIVFRRGAFSPQTKEGKQLLAHELAHVVQQPPLIQRKSDAAEVDASAEQVSASRPADSGVGEGIDVIFILTSAPGDAPPQKAYIEGMTSYIKNVLQADNVFEIQGLTDIFETLEAQASYGEKKVRRI